MPQGIARDGATGEEPFNQDWGDIGLKPGARLSISLRIW